MNNLEFAVELQDRLDQAMVEGLVTGWMDNNASQVKYEGGSEVKIATLSTDGLGDYSRGAGAGAYSTGNINLKFKTYSMEYDRARAFELDAMDVDETGFRATASNAMKEFQRSHVIPEVDAIRLMKCYKSANAVGHVRTGYSINPVDIIKEIKTGIKAIRQANYNGDLVCHITYDAMYAVQENTLGKLVDATFSKNGIDTRVPSIDGVPLIETHENRMLTELTLLDGKSVGQEKGGFGAGVGAQQIHFIIMAVDTPLAITKQDLMRVFDPSTYQGANAWRMDYRRYSDLWVLENKRETIYACTGDLATPLSSTKATKKSN